MSRHIIHPGCVRTALAEPVHESAGHVGIALEDPAHIGLEPVIAVGKEPVDLFFFTQSHEARIKIPGHELALCQQRIMRCHICDRRPAHQVEPVHMVLRHPEAERFQSQAFRYIIEKGKFHDHLDTGFMHGTDHGPEFPVRLPRGAVSRLRRKIPALCKAPVIQLSAGGNLLILFGQIGRNRYPSLLDLFKFIAGHQNDLVDSQVFQIPDLFRQSQKRSGVFDLCPAATCKSPDMQAIGNDLVIGYARRRVIAPVILCFRK